MLDYQHIKKLAADAGFDLCGLTPCGHMAQNEAWLRAWLGKGYQSSLTYMERNVEKRADPRKLVEGARTAVVCAVSYKSRIGEGYPPGHRTKIASYACTADYHTTIKGMLNGMLEHLKAAVPGLGGRAFVDTAPLLEKQLAVEAGLGWIGRQSLLVTPRHGTYVLLGELLLTDEADAYDAPFEGSRCGRCRNCIESCPTGAIIAPKVIDTGRCISCHTIEREPSGGIDLDGWIFGCDRCQSCCPHNQKAPMHANRAFDPVFDPLTMDAAAWMVLDETEFEARMGATPLTRSGLAANDIACCVVATLSAPTATPSIACRIQAALGLPENRPAFDVNAACSGFIYAAAAAHGLLSTLGGSLAARHSPAWWTRLTARPVYCLATARVRLFLSWPKMHRSP